MLYYCEDCKMFFTDKRKIEDEKCPLCDGKNIKVRRG